MNLELWQTEWCPSSHRVRQRLTELGLDCLIRQVPVERGQRTELFEATGSDSIPVLVADGEVVPGEEAILGYLENNFTEHSGVEQHRRKAAKAKRKELEKACLEL